MFSVVVVEMEISLDTQIYRKVNYNCFHFDTLNINEVDIDGYTKLHHAIRSCYPDLVYELASNENCNLLLCYDENVNVIEPFFHFAVRFGCLKCIQSLWKAMEKRNIQYNIHLKNRDGQTIIHIAALYGQIEKLEYFKNTLQYDVINIRNVDFETPYEASRCVDDLFDFKVAHFYNSVKV